MLNMGLLKRYLVPIILIIVVVVGYILFQKNNKAEKIQIATVGNYTAGYYKGNFVWGAAMNFAWSDLCENIIKDTIQLSVYDSISRSMIHQLNNPQVTTNDLDKESYYVKSGYGQKTVDAINTETAKRFPGKSFSALSESLTDNDIIAYAYLLKEVSYLQKFSSAETLFKEQKVSGFSASSDKEKEIVKVLQYINDDKFIISLGLKDEADQLLLAKGYNMIDPATVIEIINETNNENLYSITSDDNFEAPKLNLEYSRKYDAIIGKPFANKGFKNYAVKQMFENIKFKMDEVGARVENEAEIVTYDTVRNMNVHPIPKYFVLNKPFWLVMQRKGSKHPYFLLGVNNDELMERIR